MNEPIDSIKLSNKAQHDYELVRLAGAGDQRAFAELMERYRDSIYYMLLRMVNNRSDAEDLTIEAFGKAFRFIDQYVPNYAFSTWLFKIATNNCIDFIRKKKEGLLSIDQAEEEDRPGVYVRSDIPDPEEDMINRQKIKLMQSVLKKLKPNYQELIELRYFKDYSYEEISDILDIPIGTVKAQLFRARDLIYNILSKVQSK